MNIEKISANPVPLRDIIEYGNDSVACKVLHKT